MAKVRKRGNAYQIDFFDPSGKRVRISFKTKKEAEEELSKRIVMKAENRWLDVKQESKTTFEEAVEQYEKIYKNQPIYKTAKKTYLKNFSEYFGDETLLKDIGLKDIEAYRTHLSEKLTKAGTFRKPATINREMSCLHHLFDKAVEWDMIPYDTNPFNKRSKSFLLKEQNQRVRYLTEDETKALLSECAPHLRDIVICALNTGMRRGEILSLKWKQIRGGFIYLTKTKTREARQIPINETVKALFAKIRAERRSHNKKVVDMKGKPLKPIKSEYVFVYQGKPIKELKSSFTTAVDEAGLDDFRFHDLRHCFASSLVMRGASLKAVQELLGHKNISQTMRYSHLSSQHKIDAVGLPDEKSNCHKMSQNEKRGHG